VSATRVLVVDDEPMVREVLARYLEKEGFDVEVAEDGEQALAAFASTSPDLVLLDLMLPRIDGLEVFRRMRERSGADVTKPFSPREVVARVRAVLRRSTPPATDPHRVVVVGDLEVDGPRRELRRAGTPVRLTRKEFDLLFLLASNAGRTFSRSELLDDVWDFAWDGDTATVTVHVRRLREKIEDDPSKPRHLVTVWGVGYRFDP
jgi:two-component system response regulator ResD